MRFACSDFLSVAACSVSVRAEATEIDFSGTWLVDLRTPTERTNKLECGIAIFKLSHQDKKISGNHLFATPGCGRVNEGGEGTVKGYVVDSTAFLVVTSGRNGAIVMGKASRIANSLHWLVLDEIRPGEPQRIRP